MQNVVWDVRNRGIKPEILRALEEQVGCKLPTEYKEFLASQNGGVPKFKTFHTSAYRGPHGELAQFFALSDNLATAKPGKNAAIKPISTVLYNHPQLPQHLLPIAEDGYNNIVVLCLDGSNEGSIELYVCSNQGGKMKGALKTYALANSFAAFLENFSHGVYTEIIGGKKIVYKLEALNERLDKVLAHVCGQFGATAMIFPRQAQSKLVSLSISAQSYDDLLHLVASEHSLNIERKSDGSWVFNGS